MEQLRQKKLFLLDIDGTICKGDGLIDGAGAFLEAIRQRGGQFIFITNNATRSTRDYIRFSGNSGWRPARISTSQPLMLPSSI